MKQITTIDPLVASIVDDAIAATNAAAGQLVRVNPSLRRVPGLQLSGDDTAAVINVIRAYAAGMRDLAPRLREAAQEFERAVAVLAQNGSRS